MKTSTSTVEMSPQNISKAKPLGEFRLRKFIRSGMMEGHELRTNETNNCLEFEIKLIWMILIKSLMLGIKEKLISIADKGVLWINNFFY